MKLLVKQKEQKEMNGTVTWCLKAGTVEPEETSTARQWLSKQVSAAMDTQATTEELLERYILFDPCEVVIKTSSDENSQSSSRVHSEQLVKSWALQGRLRIWCYEFNWQMDCAV
jgi:hypothetical protein